MNITNFEFKARVDELEVPEAKLLEFNPRFAGTDHQIDTYFDAPYGRLKLREGNIEHALIQYQRENLAHAKKSEVVLFRTPKDPALKSILTTQFGIKAVVDKVRKIYFIDHVKFHFDHVKDLGTFVEVEAIDESGKRDVKDLKQLCDRYFDLFGLKPQDLIENSYCDMIMAKKL